MFTVAACKEVAPLKPLEKPAAAADGIAPGVLTKCICIGVRQGGGGSEVCFHLTFICCQVQVLTSRVMTSPNTSSSSPPPEGVKGAIASAGTKSQCSVESVLCAGASGLYDIIFFAVDCAKHIVA